MTEKKLYILGTRGIPAKHGGFETFAEKLSLYLSSKGWTVTVFCQEEGNRETFTSTWKNINLIHIPVKPKGTLGTIVFDWKSIKYSLNENGIFLTLGYNTAIFNILQRIKGQTNLINMDGIEWKRDKWSFIAKSWFWFNERVGCWIGNHLIADHPYIKDHLSTRICPEKITMIPYGADKVTNADQSLLDEYNITALNYSIIIARPEPENSILEMVKAFSNKHRGHQLVVLGSFVPEKNKYHKNIINSASEEVIFPGAIYDSKTIQALRFYCRYYLHGHQVGGTNPSLVEALGAGCAVIAHSNHFNRWVAGSSAIYFEDEKSFSDLLDKALSDRKSLEHMKAGSYKRFQESFVWEDVLHKYEKLLSAWRPCIEPESEEQSSPNT